MTETVKAVTDKWSGRKIVGFLIMEGIATWFTYIKILTGDQWVSFSSVLFALFLAGNITAKAIIAHYGTKAKE